MMLDTDVADFWVMILVMWIRIHIMCIKGSIPAFTVTLLI